MAKSNKKPKDVKKPLTQAEFDAMLLKVFGPSRVIERKSQGQPEATNNTYEVTFHKLPPKE